MLHGDETGGGRGRLLEMGVLCALCRGDLEGWEGLPPPLAVASQLSTVRVDRNVPPLSTRGAAGRPQACMVMARQVPGLKGCWAASRETARTWVGNCGRRE